MYVVLYCALILWLGVKTGLLWISAFLGLLFAIVVGVVVVYGRRRSTQQDALLWALAIAAEREMPLSSTLDAFAGQCRGRYRRTVLAAAESSRQGRTLTELIDEEPGLFPRDVEVLIRIGSESGMLAGALRESTTTRASTRGPWVALAARLTYFLGVLILLQTIVLFISYFIMPKFEAIFADFGVSLPAITVMTLEAGHLVARWWPLFIVLIPAQIGLLSLASYSMFSVVPWDLPLLDRLFLRRHSALILRCLARVVEGNKPLAQGLASLARTYPVRGIRQRLTLVSRDVDRGEDWCESLAHRGLIRWPEAVLLEAARRAGNLPWAMREAAENSERRLVYRLQAMVAWFLPLLLILLGAIVFVLAVSYFIPMITLIQRLA
jgi:type II secretory pathway component PulF